MLEALSHRIYMTEEKNVKFNGKNLFYRYLSRAENSKNILFLHGFSFTSGDWERIKAMNHFADLGYNVYAPDYPGFGKSEKNENFSVERGELENARLFAQTFMEFHNIKKYSILGASMGGGMAVLGALNFPESVEEMILVGPAWVNSSMLMKLEMKTLFIWGENDNVVPYDELIKDIGRKTNFSYEIVKKAGHPAYLDQPEEFFKIVDKFLKK